MHSSSSLPEPPSRPGYALYVLPFVATWALSHGYLGLFHDAGLYTLQALAHWHPTTVGRDVFLRFGSQDQFTVFSPLYATVIQLSGVEAAASLLTLILQAALLTALFILGRAILPRQWAMAGVFVAFAIPGDYGAERIFTCFESFLTPRMAAEALTLAAIAASIKGRRTPAIVLLLAAIAFHPVMAAAGVAALAFRHLVSVHPRIGGFALAAVLGVAVAMAYLASPGPWGRFDAAWLALILRRSPYLFLSDWQPDDWSRVVITLVTLLMGGLRLNTLEARALSQMALFTTVSGLVLTGFACDWLHLVAFARLQPWRWQWLGTLVAALLFPGLLAMLWKAHRPGKTAALLLVAAWIFGANGYGLTAAIGVIPSFAWTHRLKAGESRWLPWGAAALLLIAIVWRVASDLQFTDSYYLDTRIPQWIRRTISFAHDGIAPIAIFALVVTCARRRHRTLVVVLGALMATLVAALVPQTGRSWTTQESGTRDKLRFAPLKASIPATAEVFWPDNPLGTWVLLDRPNYISVIQTSGMIFSRASALELNRRAESLGAAISPDTFMAWRTTGTSLNLTRRQLLDACATRTFDFLVTSADLGLQPLASTSAMREIGSRPARLYSCRPTTSGPRSAPPGI